jgi:hypothetical protein
MAKQTEQQKHMKALMKEVKKYVKDWNRGLINKKPVNFFLKHHTSPALYNDDCFQYYWNNRYSPNKFEEVIQEIKIPIEIPQKAVVLGEAGCFYMDGTGGASNTQLKRMIRDKEVPDVGKMEHILHSSCFAVKTLTLQLKVHKTLREPKTTTNPYLHFNNNWWFWYLEELTRYEEKGRAFDLLMERTNLCEDVIGLIGEYL